MNTIELPKRIKCWEIMNCNKTECPAYGSEELRCWIISGTQCKDEIQDTFLNKMELCIECKVFKINSATDEQKQETIDFMVKNFKEYYSMFEKVKNELTEQDHLKSQYVSVVSHHLQDSLSTIQFCLKVVLTDLVGSVPEKVREMVSRAESQSIYLLHFVKDLLNLSRVKAVKEMEMKRISLLKIIENVIKQLKPVAAKKSIMLELKDSTHGSSIFANKEAIEQLFINLLVNGIKYTNPDGKVGIEIVEEKCFRIIVWDTGIGIPEVELPHIFDDFYRATNTKQIKEKGTGLGLSIVKQIVSAHKGEIRVESELNKGSKFILILPKGREIRDE